MSLVRRVANLLVALAFIVGAQTHAMPMVSMANADMGMAAMAHGSFSDKCKGCGQSGAVKVDCTAICVPAVAIIQPAPIAQPMTHDAVWIWVRDAERTRATAPDTAPPRS